MYKDKITKMNKNKITKRVENEWQNITHKLGVKLNKKFGRSKEEILKTNKKN